ncbi:major capsid protein [Dialister invisus]|uniref:major capsid protein n=1 Tax=Dialister invisus TaxID=218538 RepID=UPI002675A2F4|nr:major capsid protein [Dialister invisus]
MPNEVSIYEPRTMGRIVEKLPPVRTFFRDTFFRREETFNTESVDVDFVKGTRKVAPFVHRIIGGKTVPNTGYETKTYKPPLVAPDKITTVDDLLKRRPGERLVSGRSPAERAVLKMSDDFRELRDMISRREELMCVQSIFTGQIPIIGEGLNEVIDFGFTNTEVISAATKKWSNAGSDPIGDLKRWHKQVQKTGFTNCNACVMADDVATAFVGHEKVQKVLDVRNYNLAVIQPRQLPNGVTYVGTIHELGMDVYTYNEWYLDDWTNPETPEEKPLVPDGMLAMLSTNANYSMYYGAITLIDEGTKEFKTVEGKYVPDTWVKRKPARRFLQLQSAPLSVPHDVDSWFTAKVL